MFSCVVVGGSGFLGQALVQRLAVNKNKWERIVVFDIKNVTQSRGTGAVVFQQGDIRRQDDLVAAFKDASVVFHCATAAPSAENAKNKEIMYTVNVEGTRNVIEACKICHVRSLIYVSSASVVFRGQDLEGVDESIQIPKRHVDFYTETKAIAERAVLDANSSQLHTCCLRPSGIFGEKDPLFVPTLISNARKGKMKYYIGDGTNRMDWTFVDNVAYALELAADGLQQSSQRIGGQVYFITNDDARPFWGFLGDILQGLGYPRPTRRLPFWLIYILSWLFLWFSRLISPWIQLESDFTPFRILLSVRNRRVSCEKAKRELGYKPIVSMEEGLQRTIAYFSFLRNP
ncbi:Sterol-4-alpha-carboxylate 3-dehydrogenase, decarboxylating [Galdieria sulphuraria]|nr:Sterol-4-alpha-carboxylate 3-dehydrogenase, decarboxylating [Galdieria sulphuraria]